jgi:rhodanese-related sulfurtransferase
MDGEILPEELEATLDGNPPLVVDIRSPDAFRKGHIPDSVNVPFEEVPHTVDRVADAEHVVTVCPHGEASVRAARLISAYEGFNGRVESLEGGLTAWDGPVERSDDEETAESEETTTSNAPF